MLVLVALPVLTLLLYLARDSLSLESIVLLYLLGVLAASLAGGVIVAILAAVTSSAVINFYFVEPLHTLDVGRGDQAVALAVFVVVAVIVSGAVELAARRTRAAEQSAREAETLSTLAGADLDEAAALTTVLERARKSFAVQSVALQTGDRATDVWEDVERVGAVSTGQTSVGFDIEIKPYMRFIGWGPALPAEDQRVLRAFAAAAETAFDGRRLTEQARAAETLAAIDRQRTALLAAVSHDLRTPLAGIKAGVTSLRQDDVTWSPEEQRELLGAIETSADRLNYLVANLLDASRLQAGVLAVQARSVAIDEVVSSALLSLPDAPEHVELDVPDDLPLVCADPGLLERIIANLVDNALRHAGGPVQIRAVAADRSADLEIIDHGPGIGAGDHERLFAPFQRLDDHHTNGVGLGLWIARGFAEAMGATLVADPSAGGGVTMRLRLPLAARHEARA